MNDDVQVIVALFMLIAFIVAVKGRRSGARHQRELMNTVAQLQAQQAAPPPPQSGPSQEQFDRLEQRLRVLERIVTDKSYDLASQIEALRDERTIEQRSESREVERSS